MLRKIKNNVSVEIMDFNTNLKKQNQKSKTKKIQRKKKREKFFNAFESGNISITTN